MCACPFFLRVLPEADEVDLPTTRDGHVIMDFEVVLADVAQSDGSCVFEREVPFVFRQLRTGQFERDGANAMRRVWKRDIPRA